MAPKEFPRKLWKFCWSGNSVDQHKTMWIWFGVKLLQSSNTHQNERSHSRKLSSASWRKDDVSLVRFLIWPANNKKKPTSYENTPCLAWNRFGLPLLVALLRICSSQSVQHIQVVVKSHYSLNELELFCFLIDLRRRLGPFRTFIAQSCQQEWNHCARLRCEHLKSLVSPFALQFTAIRP